MDKKIRPKIKKGDEVLVLTGRDKGKKGKVIKMTPKAGRVIVEGVNLRKKHVRPKKSNEKGETVLVPSPLHISDLQLICPSCSKPTRVGFKGEGESKARRCKKCDDVIN